MAAEGRCNTPTKEQHGNAHLDSQKVSFIKQAINDGTHTQGALGRMFGVSRNTIHAIRCELTWVEVEPRIRDLIPQPNRKLSDFDYVDIRRLWDQKLSLKEIADRYTCRVDYIQAILNGKRGKSAPVGLRVIRQNHTKHDHTTRQEMLRRYMAGETQVALAKEYGMSKNGISLALQSERRMAAAGGVS